MSDLTAELRAYAQEKRVDLLGIAPIERFDGVPADHHPSSIFPETKSVIVLGKRVPRGALRGVEEGTQFDLYGQFGNTWLRDRMLAMTTITIATWVEDNGWEAVPIQDLPVETPPSGIAVKPDAPAPNVMVDLDQAAVRAGLGEIDYLGLFISPEYGPRQRLQMILTDAELEPTPLLLEPISTWREECIAACPMGAVSAEGEQVLEICGKQMTVAKIDYGICRRCKNGAGANPHHASGKPDRMAAVCCRTLVDTLERAGRVGNAFAAPFRKRPAWIVDETGRPKLAEEAVS